MAMSATSFSLRRNCFTPLKVLEASARSRHGPDQFAVYPAPCSLSRPRSSEPLAPPHASTTARPMARTAATSPGRDAYSAAHSAGIEERGEEGRGAVN